MPDCAGAHASGYRAIGVRNDPEYLKCSAITATTTLLEYLAHKGSTSMHLGMSRSFPDDGILRSRANSGMKFWVPTAQARYSGCCVRVPPPTAFISNPFAHLDGEKLYAAMLFLTIICHNRSSLEADNRKKYNGIVSRVALTARRTRR